MEMNSIQNSKWAHTNIHEAFPSKYTSEYESHISLHVKKFIINVIQNFIDEDFIYFEPPYNTNISSTIIQVHLYPASYYLLGGVIGSQSNMYVLTFDICTW